MSYLARSKPHTIFSVIKECGTFSTGCTGYRVNLYSQNHRMVEVGNDLWRSPCPTPAQAGPPTTSFPGPDQLAFEYPQGERLLPSPDNLGQCLAALTEKYGYFFILCLNRTPCLSFCAYHFSACHQPLLSIVRKKKKNNPKTLS